MLSLWKRGYRVENNSSSTKRCKHIWTLSKLERKNWAAPAQIISFAVWSDSCKYRSWQAELGTFWNDRRKPTIYASNGLYLWAPLEIWRELESQKMFKARSHIESVTVHYDWWEFRISSIMRKIYLLSFWRIGSYKPVYFLFEIG